MCNDQPWMTAHIKDCINLRNKLFKQGKMEEWVLQARVVKHQINKRKKIYYNRFGNKDSKTLWEIVNTTRGTGKNKLKGDCIVTENEHSDYCRSQWSNDEPPDLSPYITTQKQHNFVITRRMVLKELEKLDTSKAPGPDNISNTILKGAREDIIITDLFNISVKNSFVLSQ